MKAHLAQGLPDFLYEQTVPDFLPKRQGILFGKFVSLTPGNKNPPKTATFHRLFFLGGILRVHCGTCAPPKCLDSEQCAQFLLLSTVYPETSVSKFLRSCGKNPIP